MSDREPEVRAETGRVAPGDAEADRPPRAREAELERSLGLPAALSVGMGTMIGAGIFVFPGLAAGRAGPAASLSFALGAGIALLVALPASELASAMPRSGGAYYFVSRGLGTFAGTLVGLGQWFGLVFASAFYLVGFGHYVAETGRAVGLGGALPTSWVGCAAAAVLTAISLAGTRKAGSLQNAIVAALVTVLLVFLVWGTLGWLGLLDGRPREPEAFAPYGALPVLTTAALVFTSYLGFAQIAAVGGEIRDPGRTIPRAMLGSVALVGLLYMVTLLVATRFLSATTMAGLGETAMVEFARRLAGRGGAAVLLGAGVLATLSSANASILSSSRSVFALSRDGLVPRAAAAVNARFRTPHVALLLAGIPIAALALLGRVDVLAEVASLLHLVMYGLLCFALLALRRRRPPGYRPRFRAPGASLLPSLGGVASFGLIGFMGRASQAIGGGILLAAAIWYLVYARSVDLKETD